jgi:hypothetical protein
MTNTFLKRLEHIIAQSQNPGKNAGYEAKSTADNFPKNSTSFSSIKLLVDSL